GSRRASKPVAGNARRSGPCCVTPPIKAPPASARHRPRHGNVSPGRYACVAVLRRVTVHTMSGHRTSGSRFQCCRSSMSRPSRLLTAYQEDLLSLDELRHRMPELRRREYATRAELQSIADQTIDRTAYLRLAETLTAFLA